MPDVKRCHPILHHRGETLERGEQLAGQRHDHRLARAAASVGGLRVKPLGQRTVFLKPQKGAPHPPQLLSASTIAESKVGHVIGVPM